MQEVKIVLVEGVEELCLKAGEKLKSEYCKACDKILSIAKTIELEEIKKILDKEKWMYGQKVLQGTKGYMNPAEIIENQAVALFEYIIKQPRVECKTTKLGVIESIEKTLRGFPFIKERYEKNNIGILSNAIVDELEKNGFEIIRGKEEPLSEGSKNEG